MVAILRRVKTEKSVTFAMMFFLCISLCVSLRAESSAVVIVSKEIDAPLEILGFTRVPLTMQNIKSMQKPVFEEDGVKLGKKTFNFKGDEAWGTIVKRLVSFAVGIPPEEAYAVVTNKLIIIMDPKIVSRHIGMSGCISFAHDFPPIGVIDGVMRTYASSDIALLQLDNIYFLTKRLDYDKKTPIIITGRLSNITGLSPRIELSSRSLHINDDQAIVVGADGMYTCIAYTWLNTQVVKIGGERYVPRDSELRIHDVDIRVGGVMAKRLTIDLNKELVYHVDIDLGALGVDSDDEKEEK